MIASSASSSTYAPRSGNSISNNKNNDVDNNENNDIMEVWAWSEVIPVTIFKEIIQEDDDDDGSVYQDRSNISNSNRRAFRV